MLRQVELRQVRLCAVSAAICQDQVLFLTQMLDLNGLKERLAGLIYLRSQQQKNESLYRTEALLPLHHILAAGPLTRGEFVQMTGLAERTGHKVLSQLLFWTCDTRARNRASRVAHRPSQATR